jgi:hypothetical protein
MPATAMMSWTTPASFFSPTSTATAAAALSTASSVTSPLLLATSSLPTLLSSQVAVRLLKNSEELSRRTGGCFDRAIVRIQHGRMQTMSDESDWQNSKQCKLHKKTCRRRQKLDASKECRLWSNWAGCRRCKVREADLDRWHQCRNADRRRDVGWLTLSRHAEKVETGPLAKPASSLTEHRLWRPIEHVSTLTMSRYNVGALSYSCCDRQDVENDSD